MSETLPWQLEEDAFAFAGALVDAYTSRNIKMGGDLSAREWVHLFRWVGFVSDGAAPPEGRVTVYRGCLPGQWKRTGWTADLDIAMWFANTSSFGQVYVATVEPRHVLARFDEMDEAEIVVSPFVAPLRRPTTLPLTRGEIAQGAARVVQRRLTTVDNDSEKSR